MMIDRVTCSLAALMMAAAVIRPVQGIPLVLVDAGKAMATIVVPAEPSNTEQIAAGDLRDYIVQMTATDLPIVAGAMPERGAAILVGAGRELVGPWLTTAHVGDDDRVAVRHEIVADISGVRTGLDL